jgi:hypothetical protein
MIKSLIEPSISKFTYSLTGAVPEHGMFIEIALKYYSFCDMP